MKILKTVLGSLFVAASLQVAPALAQTAVSALPAPVTRDHSATIHGQTFSYTATFDRFEIASPSGKVGGAITTIAYLRKAPSVAARPVLFAFNGGPGSSSMFLNAGLLGPNRVDLPSDPAQAVPARAPVVANTDSILDAVDIVLIDPVGTGFSRLLDPDAGSYFYSVQGDAQAVADAIIAWTKAHGREASPKYVLGESYGATRAVLASRSLLKSPQTANLQGVVLLSQSVSIVDTVQRRSNTVGQIVGLPTIAASAWYHGLAGKGRSLDAFVAEAATFGRQEWLPALIAGNTLPSPEKAKVARRLAAYTGVRPEALIKNDLYLSKEDYRRMALADKGLMLGLYDTRYTGPLSARQAPDAALSAAIGSAAEDVLQRELGVSAADYRVAGGGFPDGPRGDRWIYFRQPFATTSGENYRQIDYVADLQQLMGDQSQIRVMVVGGWYDTAASAGADDYLMSRPGLDLKRMRARHYVGGHMFYTDPHSRTAFADSLRAFMPPSQ